MHTGTRRHTWSICGFRNRTKQLNAILPRCVLCLFVCLCSYSLFLIKILALFVALALFLYRSTMRFFVYSVFNCMTWNIELFFVLFYFFKQNERNSSHRFHLERKMCSWNGSKMENSSDSMKKKSSTSVWEREREREHRHGWMKERNRPTMDAKRSEMKWDEKKLSSHNNEAVDYWHA